MTTLRTIDAHTAGEPLRLIVGGFPRIEGTTMLERREWVRANCDHLRTALMLEPRGHADMYGALLTEPERADSDAGVLFMHNEGYSTMCGHGVIAVVTMAIERGLIVPRRRRHDRARRAGRPDTGASRDSPPRRPDAGRARQLRQRAVVRSSGGGAGFDSVAARSAPTWRLAAHSTRLWMPNPLAWRSDQDSWASSGASA